MKQFPMKLFLAGFIACLFYVAIPCYAQQPVVSAPLVVRKSSLTLELARKIASACEAKARDLGVSVGIVVLDESGNLKLAYLMDKQSSLSLEWAKAKALSAFEFKQATDKGEFRVWNIAEKTMALGVYGGMPLLQDKNILGAIGVSGSKGKEDDFIAQAGLEEFEKIFR